MAPLDQFQRPLHDLRISVTDRCNFRCTYCMPKEVFGRDHPFLPKAEILSFEEIARVARCFVSLGVEKVRLTGGEPLLRKDLDRLVAQLAAIDGLRDLTLTTNGSLLAQQGEKLRAAGLRRVTVSLDALDDATFRAMNDVDFPVSRVLDGIDAALAAGFAPIKINTVIRRGVNEHAIEELAARFGGLEFVVRFIEYMDVGNTNGWRLNDVVPAAEIAARLQGRSGASPLSATNEAAGRRFHPLPPNYRGEVARRFRTAAGGEIGIISSVTQPFCRDCTRARITADGHLYTCLFGTHGHDLRPLLRSSATDEALAQFLATVWRARGDRYSDLRTSATPREPKVEMSAIGG